MNSNGPDIAVQQRLTPNVIQWRALPQLYYSHINFYLHSNIFCATDIKDKITIMLTVHGGLWWQLGNLQKSCSGFFLFFFFCSTIIFNRLNCILFLPTTIYWMCSRLQCTKRTLQILYTVYITQNDWYKLWFFFLLTFKWLWAAQIAGICFFFFFNFLFVCVYILFNTITASTSW